MKIKQLIAIKYIRLKISLLSFISKRRAALLAFEIFTTPPEKHSGLTTAAVFNFAEPLYEYLDGLKINGYCWNKGKATKVLILHGFSSSAAKFHHFILPLIEKGYEVIAFDAPAHGNSEGKTVNVLQYSLLIEKIYKNYGPINGFIAHSFGGIAVCLALENIPHDENTKLVLLAPATETASAIDNTFTLLNIKNKKVREEFDQLIFEKSGHQPEWFSIKRAMQNCKATTLWFHDEEDDLTPLRDALNVKDLNLPNIQFIISKGLGHRRIYHDSFVKNELINFL